MKLKDRYKRAKPLYKRDILIFLDESTACILTGFSEIGQGFVYFWKWLRLTVWWAGLMLITPILHYRAERKNKNEQH